MQAVNGMTDPGNREGGYRRAFLLIVMFGIISAFSNMDYKSGHSLNGSFLGELGASAVAVGLITGIAEFLGSSLRLFTGLLVDKTRFYWGFTFLGYGMLVVVPLMALSQTWQFAALLIVLERISKAVRVPAKDTILSMAARRVGTGLGFGIHKALDQVGGIIGPLAMSLVLSGAFGNKFTGLDSYRSAYSLLWIPFAFMCIAALATHRMVPDPETLEKELDGNKKVHKKLQVLAPGEGKIPGKKLSRLFWIYSVFTALTSLGFINFNLLSFHANAEGILAESAIPFYYSLAMAGGGIAAFLAGKLYDKFGLNLMYIVPVISIPLPFLGFLGSSSALLIVAILLFGISLGIQETIAKAAVADLTTIEKRGLGFGVFNTVNGIGVLASGAVMGYLFTHSPVMVCIFTTIAELAGLLTLSVFMGKYRLQEGAAKKSISPDH